MAAGARSWLVRVLCPALLVVAAAGCRGAPADAPVDGHHELCCKAANPDNVSFVGCRATGYCRTGEEVWVRGPVSCTTAGPEHCAGGRCCKLVVEVPDLPETEAEGDASAPETPTPEPAPVVPVPLDLHADSGQSAGG